MLNVLLGLPAVVGECFRSLDATPIASESNPYAERAEDCSRREALI